MQTTATGQESGNADAATASEHPAVLEVTDLSVRYGEAADVVTGVSLRIGRGETVAVVGESGSGKSTLISAILGMLPEGGRITAGSVVLSGRVVSALSEKELQQVRGREIGLVPQDPISNFNPVTKVVVQSIDADRAHAQHSRAQSMERVLQGYAQADLKDVDNLRKKYPHQLSGGMRQRALIATSLLHHPALVLADEPTSALDAITQKRVLDRFETLVTENGSAVLFVTHDLELAMERADRIVVMKAGRVVEQRTSVELREAPAQPYTRALLAASERFSGSEQRDSTELLAVAPVVMQGTGVWKSFDRKLKPGARRAVDDVSFELKQGTTLAVVGASGSGKTTLSSMALGFLQPSGGEITWHGKDVQRLGRGDLKEFRRAVQPVFQDPHTSLNPSYTVERTLDESLRQAGLSDRTARIRRAIELLDQVALSQQLLGRYPHELSGGQKQRVAIARALSLSPEILICDEPVSALDVVVQSQVIDLLQEIQTEMGLSILLISHDLGVVSSISDEVMVMRNGQVVDSGPTRTVFTAPTSDYTRELLDSIPNYQPTASVAGETP